MYYKNLTKKAFEAFVHGIRISSQSSGVKKQMKYKAFKQFSTSMKSKSLKALKLYCYRMRVSNYLVSVTRHKFLTKYFSKYREEFLNS